jgi:hypothetical protein
MKFRTRRNKLDSLEMPNVKSFALQNPLHCRDSRTRLICLIPGPASCPELWAFQCERCGQFTAVLAPDDDRPATQAAH